MMLHPLKRCLSFNLSIRKVSNKDSTDIVSVAFNNEHVISLQIGCIKKYIQGNYTYIVADNSSDAMVSEKIKTVCLQNNVPYIRLPKNRLNIIGPSYSHAAALNYVYRKIIKKRCPTCFGFIDHDLFPIKPINIQQKMASQPIYGAKRMRGNCWYLSAIISFFKYDFVCDKNVDFMPVMPCRDYLDTGGGNWYGIYSHMDVSKLTFVTERIENFRKGGNRHQDCLEFLDDCWLHTINGSYWKKTELKDDRLESIIEKYRQ